MLMILIRVKEMIYKVNVLRMWNGIGIQSFGGSISFGQKGYFL